MISGKNIFGVDVANGNRFEYISLEEPLIERECIVAAFEKPDMEYLLYAKCLGSIVGLEHVEETVEFVIEGLNFEDMEKDVELGSDWIVCADEIGEYFL